MGANQSLLSLSNSAQALAFKQYTPADHSFWNELWSTDTTPEQLWSCLSTPLLVQIRDAQPANLACLLHKVLGKMTEIVFASKGSLAAVKPTHTFANVYTASVQNGTQVQPGMQDPVVINSVSILLNCVRILTRILAVLGEDPTGPWWSSYLWGGSLPFLSPAQVGESLDPSLLRGVFHGQSLGKVILLLLTDLLFTEGFAVHTSLATPVLNKESLRHNGVQLDKLWELGVTTGPGQHATAGPPNLPNIKQWIQVSTGWSNYDTNRVEVLRCLLVCFCEPIFLPPNTGGPTAATPPQTPKSTSALPSPSPKGTGGVVVPFAPNRFLAEFVSESSPCARWTPTLCWSLLNIVLNYYPGGASGMMSALPYNHTMVSDDREPLVELSLHFLLLLLDHRQGPANALLDEEAHRAAKEKSVVVINPPIKRMEEEGNEEQEGGEHKGHEAASTSTSLVAEQEAQSSREAKGDILGEAAAEKVAAAGDHVDEATKSLAGASITSSNSSNSRNGTPQATSTAVTPTSSSPSSSSTSASTPPARTTNVFHAILTELSNGPCLSSLYNHLCRLLLNALKAESTWMPGSLKKLSCFQELLILMWKLADENEYFVPHILNSTPSARPELRCDIINLVGPLLYFVHESRNDESQLGLTYVATFLLLRLSGEREFSVALNRPVHPSANANAASALLDSSEMDQVNLFALLGMPYITAGTYADALIVVAHRLVISSPTHLDALLKVLLTLLCNISPYLTRLSLFASVKLLSLFDLFVSPAFLHANPTNHQYATMMLDIFNNIIQYQYQGHANLVYSIIRRAKLFHELGRLDHTDSPSTSAANTPTNQSQQAGAQRQGWTGIQHPPKRDLHASAKVPSTVANTIALAESDHPKQQQPPAAASSQAPSSGTGSGSSTPSNSSRTLSSSTAPSHSFLPTSAWRNSWKRVLPLEPVYRLLDFFQPKVDSILAIGGPTAPVDEAAILHMINATTLVGVLPVPHPIVVRKYIRNAMTSLWFSTYLTGIVFLRQQALAQLTYGICSGAPLWNAQAVKMFVIASQRGAQQQQQTQHTQQQQQQQPQQSQSLSQSLSQSQSQTSAANAGAQQPAPADAPDAQIVH